LSSIQATLVVRNSDLVLLACWLVSSWHVQDAISVNVEGDLDLWDTARRWWNARKLELAVLGHGKPTKYVEEAISISNADLILPPNEEKLAADAKTDYNSCLFQASRSSSTRYSAVVASNERPCRRKRVSASSKRCTLPAKCKPSWPIYSTRQNPCSPCPQLSTWPWQPSWPSAPSNCPVRGLQIWIRGKSEEDGGKEFEVEEFYVKYKSLSCMHYE